MARPLGLNNDDPATRADYELRARLLNNWPAPPGLPPTLDETPLLLLPWFHAEPIEDVKKPARRWDGEDVEDAA